MSQSWYKQCRCILGDFWHHEIEIHSLVWRLSKKQRRPPWFCHCVSVDFGWCPKLNNLFELTERAAFFSFMSISISTFFDYSCSDLIKNCFNFKNSNLLKVNENVSSMCKFPRRFLVFHYNFSMALMNNFRRKCHVFASLKMDKW